ncbi:MAG: ATP-binding protein [Isosphaeraceae bacterium]
MAVVGVGIAIVLVLWIANAAFRQAKAVEELQKRVATLGQGKSSVPVLIRVGGPVGRLIRLFVEVAPQLEARMNQLEQDRRQLSAVLSGMAEGVIAVDGRRRLLFANASADKLFGLGAGSVGRLVPELIRSPHFQEAVEATLASFEPYRGEITMVGRDPLFRAYPRVLSVHGTPLPGSPAEGAVLVIHDVTELRRLERMRQDFVANVSHELKTPLASIKAYTETLLDWALHDENVNVRFLMRIDEQAERLNQLILDLLSLARLESNVEVYEHRPLALASVIASCVESHRDRALSKDQSLIFEQGTLREDTRVVADQEAIRQIFDNLIDNALKYTPEGGSVRISCRSTSDLIHVDVVDTGIGIPRDDLPRVFERFYRVDKARSRELGGTGLGLSIVKHLVQSIGGQIQVESRLGAGSRFTLQLPVYHDETPAPSPPRIP